MTTSWNITPNSQALKRGYFGTEAIAGTAVTPTYRVYGDLSLTATRQLAERQEFAGTLFADYTPVFGPWAIDGTLKQPLTYEDLAILPRYSLAGGGTGVSDAAPTPGYVYTRRPDPDSLNIDSATIEGGTPGMAWRAGGAIFPEFTISADIDDSEAVWKWDSPIKAVSRDYVASTTGTATAGTTTTVTQAAAGWTINAFSGSYVRMLTGTAGNIGQVREIESNTATVLTLTQALPATVAAADTFEILGNFTTGIADRTREMIAGPGTDLYMDATGGTIGTTAITGRFISFSVTYNSGLSTFKRFMENVDSFTAKPDLGTRRVTGQIRLEHDRLDQWNLFEAGTARKIRIKQTGSTIHAGTSTTKEATIDIYNAVFSSFSEDTRNSNITATLGFTGFVDTVEGVPWQLQAKNTLATLP
jgi:hypothetical protein